VNGDLDMNLGCRTQARGMQRPESSVRIASYFLVWLLLLCLGKAGAAAESGPVQAARGDEPATAEPARACAADAVETAKEHFARGVVLTDHSDHQGALQAFQAAYAACPHFALWYNIGQALIDLDRPLEAVAALSRYLREGQDQIPPERIDWVEEQIRLLEDLVGGLRVATTPPGALITIDGRAIGRTPLAQLIRLEPGEHKIWATLDDYEPATSTVIIGRGKRHEVALHLVPLLVDIPPPLPRPSRLREALPYLLIGAGVLSAAGAGGAYLWERRAYDRWQDAQPAVQNSQPGSPDYAKAAKESNRLAASVTSAKYATVGLAIGSGVLLTTGALLYRFDRSSKSRSGAPVIAWSGSASFTAGWRCSW
jgi:tetratricopeptide (TPR) repeat protein